MRETAAWILVLRGCAVGATHANPSGTTYCFEISVPIRVNPWFNYLLNSWTADPHVELAA
jgi:hypothetical protein